MFLLAHLRTLFISSFVAIFIAACSGGGNAEPSDTQSSVQQPPFVGNDGTESASQAILNLQQQDILPVFDTNESLAGIDANSNGIRDDIESYIASLQIADSKKSSLEETARHYQDVITTNLEIDSELRRLILSSMTMTRCLLLAHIDEPIAAQERMKAIEAFTYNTNERTRKYMEYNAALDGIFVKRPNDINCSF